ncbi:hypothetical protein V1478_000819, partial [Vespula squamosa]
NEKISDITLYLRSAFLPTTAELILRELRCAYLEIHNKTEIITAKSTRGPTLFSRAVAGMSDITLYLRSAFLPTTTELILRELRCAYLEIHNKTEIITAKSPRGPTLFSRAVAGMSDKTLYLRPLFVITCKKRIPRKFLSPLLEIQVKVDHSFDCVITIRGQGPPVQYSTLQ